MSTVIETEGLTKVYEGAFKSQDVLALKDLTIQVNEGEIFGYLGPNGSGKTTTIKLLLGLIFPTSGTMRVLGESNVYKPSVRKNNRRLDCSDSSGVDADGSHCAMRCCS